MIGIPRREPLSLLRFLAPAAAVASEREPRPPLPPVGSREQESPPRVPLTVSIADSDEWEFSSFVSGLLSLAGLLPPFSLLHHRPSVGTMTNERGGRGQTLGGGKTPRRGCRWLLSPGVLSQHLLLMFSLNLPLITPPPHSPAIASSQLHTGRDLDGGGPTLNDTPDSQPCVLQE